MYSYFSSMYSYCCLCILIVVYVFLDAATLTEVFTCFFLGCKAKARVILAKTWHGPHSSNCCVFLCIVCFVSFYVLLVCKCVLLPPGDNPIAVNKYIISYHIISYHIKEANYTGWAKIPCELVEEECCPLLEVRKSNISMYSAICSCSFCTIQRCSTFKTKSSSSLSFTVTSSLICILHW